MTFKVSENVEDGEIIPLTLTYTEGDITNQSLEDVNPAIINGSVTVQDVLYGDIYEDGKVNSKDLVLLKQYMAAWEIEFTDRMKKCADVFADGKVNAKDIVRLQQYIAGWNVVLGG